MRRTLLTLSALVVLTTGGLSAQAKFPDTPQGKLAAGFLAAVNAPDEMALARFQEANLSPAALNRRPTEERLSKNRELRELGTLKVVEVVAASATSVTLLLTASNQPGLTLTMVLGFIGGDSPKIDTIQLTA